MSTWVVGQGGLIGAGVCRALRRQGQIPFHAKPVPWGTSAAADILAENASRLVHEHPFGWSVVWCAGAGVTSTEEDKFVSEFHAFVAVMRALERDARGPGSFVFASSAGAVYGGSTPAPFTESSTPRPVSAYGRSRLSLEGELERRASSIPMNVAIARIANVYGPGQNLNKPQGLVSHLCVSALRQRPMTIYMPLDTLREYLYVDDVGMRLVAMRDDLTGEPPSATRVKILGSGTPISIAFLIEEFRRLPGPRPLIVHGHSEQRDSQAADLRFRSEVWERIDRLPRAPLAWGIERTRASVAARMVAAGDR